MDLVSSLFRLTTSRVGKGGGGELTLIDREEYRIGLPRGRNMERRRPRREFRRDLERERRWDWGTFTRMDEVRWK